MNRRISIAARIAAGTAGGYGVAALVAVAVACWWPADRAQASVAGTLAALLAWPAIVMACFHAGSATRAWAGLGGTAIVLLAAAMGAGWRP
ncbi:hypothetical protein [Gluconacetobacter diazotrophicus]|uniref:Iron uptake protein n=2 Tax=Gluconacetobacter diazotrophicus TaxID=33996 RepID=A0A7W4I6C0_GLUDI|nr:hypothetical protein [Gluconacetobacter diazotrophicus]MBB2157054.1 hypothetical protein [Gluconacetobacter diazotrophicus]TWB05571.1 hypothetical protein FBZ86_11664 [Gluconacetobacter diazotrophicus]CAP57655.1 putative membrane protein [Gluconacetobacter diazotrophicus PA1 5]